MPPLPDDFVTSGVYRIRNVFNGKVYIGSCVRCVGIRIHEHRLSLKSDKHINQHLQASYNLHGPRVFRFEVVERCLPEMCLDREQYWIDYYSSYDRRFGYNRRPKADSNLGMVLSTSAKTKMSVSAKKRLERPGELQRLLDQSKAIAIDPVVRQKISKSKIGFKHTEESKAKIAQSIKGRKHTTESKAKMSVAQKALGKKLSNEQKLAISQRQKGSKQSEETKAKRSATMKTRYQDPAQKQKLVAAATARWASPKAKGVCSAKMKALWDTPEWRRNQIERMNRGHNDQLL